jgi:hypothetical protein
MGLLRPTSAIRITRSVVQIESGEQPAENPIAAQDRAAIKVGRISF